MSKNSSAKYYQDSKRLQKKAQENLSKEEKGNNMVVNDAKISLEMKSKSCLTIEKNVTK